MEFAYPLVVVAQIVCGGFVFGSHFVAWFFMSFLVKQSSCKRRESWILYFNYVMVVCVIHSIPYGPMGISAV